MAASPETAEPPETSDTHSSPHPPSSPRLHPTQENPSLTTAAPPEMANPDQFTPVPPPPAEQSTVEHSEAEPLPPTPIDEAEPPPSHPPPPEAEPAASSAFEAIPTENVASPSPLPKDVAVEVSHEVAASAPSPSPSPSPQIVGASPEDAPQPPSPPRTPPATTAHISTDPSTTGATAMASQDQEEAARPSLAPETMDADSRTAPAPLTLPMESGPEGLLSQQKPRPPSPTLSVDEAVEGTLEKAAGSLPVPEVTNRDMDITTGMLPAWEIGSEEMLSQQQLRPPCLETAPLRGENPKSVWPPQPPPPAESTYGWSNAATNEASAVASEEATVSLEFGAERSLQEPVQTSKTSILEAEPCSPEMAPPGFEDFKSQWLPLSSPTLAESTHNVVQVAAINPVGMTPDAATESLPASEAMDVEINISPGLLPPLKSRAEVRSLQPPLGSCSPMMEAAPCSPDMPPPGFENCKSSWLPQPTIPPLCETTYALPDVASTKAGTSVEKACSVLALEATDVETGTERWRLPQLQSGTGGSLQEPLPRSPSPTMQAAPCSLDTAPPGFENMKAMHLLPPAVVLPPDETPDALADAGTKTVTMEQMRHPVSVTGATEEANGSILPAALENGCDDPLPNLEPQTSPCLAETIDPSAHSSATMPAIVKSNKTNLPLSPLQATDADMESATRQQSPLKSEERSLPQPEQHPSSPSVKNTNCSPEVAPPGYENLDSSEQLPLPPPLSMKFEMGQMVCGCCRQLLAYPKGAVHVQCFGCWTINLVLEEHQVGKVYCGECDTLLMYPFGAPAVKCSNCLFVTEIGERNVRPRISTEQSVSPHPQEVAHQS
uniref:Zinc finger LSD1-type domain-containing protein n=1 Tax=Setaria italica TaxID=4555 RepID=K3XEJ0_SETIT